MYVQASGIEVVYKFYNLNPFSIFTHFGHFFLFKIKLIRALIWECMLQCLFLKLFKIGKPASLTPLLPDVSGRCRRLPPQRPRRQRQAGLLHPRLSSKS